MNQSVKLQPNGNLNGAKRYGFGYYMFLGQNIFKLSERLYSKRNHHLVWEQSILMIMEFVMNFRELRKKSETKYVPDMSSYTPLKCVFD